MQLIDSHCHLDFSVFDRDRQQVVEKARRNGICHIIVPSISRQNWQNVACLPEQFPLVEVAYGLHPMFLSQHRDKDIDALDSWLQKHQCVAIGECGLDFYIRDTDKNRQIELFTAQLKLASKYALPVIIHARKSVDIVLKYLRQHPDVKGVIHSFSGSLQQAEYCIKQGFLLGFGGPVSYPRATKLQQLVKDLPIESIVLETDAPDQPDCLHRGERNEPGNLKEIARVIADLRHMMLAELAQVTTENARQLFMGISIN